MCILIQHPAGTSFSDEWLADFYKKNSDGIGVMYSENNVLRVFKLVPTSLESLIKFYRERCDGRECLIHLRYKTHGDIDIINCHPYKVFGSEEGYPIYLMHNGVLSTGNAADTTKSDTWHYIENFIKPALKADPKQFMEPWFKTWVESHIGYNNKFAMMDAYGNYVIFNQKSGVMWDNVWMSNTYAWDAAKAGVFKSYTYGGYGTYTTHDWRTSHKQYYDGLDEWDTPVNSNKPVTTSNVVALPSATNKDVFGDQDKKLENYKAPDVVLKEKVQALLDSPSIQVVKTEEALAVEAHNYVEVALDVLDFIGAFYAANVLSVEELSNVFYYMRDDAYDLMDYFEMYQPTSTEVIQYVRDINALYAADMESALGQAMQDDLFSKDKLAVGMV